MPAYSSSQLHQIRDAVLSLHRALLAAERIAWEALNGRVPGNAEFLRLAINDPWFAWLHQLTGLIAALDAAMNSEDPDAEAVIVALVANARELLHPSDNGDDFQQRYYEFVQRSPDVAVAHGVLMRAFVNAPG